MAGLSLFGFLRGLYGIIAARPPAPRPVADNAPLQVVLERRSVRKFTADPIPGAGTTDEPTSYVFVDDTIDPTQGYWYYVESVSMGGVHEKFSPTTYIRPKAPVD